MNFIKKLFIKDYKNVDDKNVRLRYGFTAGIIGIISNLFLFVAKLIVAIIGGSITILAEAINNLSDMGSSVVVLVGFKLSKKPADTEHPFGHARYEEIMALIVAVIVLAIGVILAKGSVEKVLSNEKTTVSLLTYIILSIAIIVKLLQMFLYRDFAKSINSEVLKASSVDSRNDAISTISVLIAMILIDIFGNLPFSIDGVFGILVSLFIIITSIKLIKETISPLLGESLSPEFIKKMKNVILSHDGVLGVHDFMIHSYGTNNYFATAHVEVDRKVDIMKSHDMIDNIEREFKENHNVSLSIHLDPIEIDNEEINTHKQNIENLLNEIEPSISLHDFRMVFGETHTNILFDVVIPFDKKIELEDIKKFLYEKYKDYPMKYFFVIDVDRV